MNFYNLIEEIVEKEKKVDIFVDMDGVIALYRREKILEFRDKRPLLANIKVLESVSKIDGVNLFILSICKKNYQKEDKNYWLDKYAPFFKKENRYILSKEEITNMSSANMKLNFLKNYKSNNKVILLDDDNEILKLIERELQQVLVLQDSELVD